MRRLIDVGVAGRGQMGYSTRIVVTSGASAYFTSTPWILTPRSHHSGVTKSEGLAGQYLP